MCTELMLLSSSSLALCSDYCSISSLGMFQSHFTSFLLKYNTKDHFSRLFQRHDHFPVYPFIFPPLPRQQTTCLHLQGLFWFISVFKLSQNIDLHFTYHSQEIFSKFLCNLKVSIMHRKAWVLFKIPLEVFVENNDLTSSLLWWLFYNSDQYVPLFLCCLVHVMLTFLGWPQERLRYLNTTVTQIIYNGKILNLIHIEMVLNQWPQQSWITYIYTHAYIQWSSHTKMKSLGTATFVFFL